MQVFLSEMQQAMAIQRIAPSKADVDQCAGATGVKPKVGGDD
jgi:hypothetical protein